RARASAEAWLLGRFLCPASLLGELAGSPLPLGVVSDGAAAAPPQGWLEAVDADLRTIAGSGAETVEVLELRLPQSAPPAELLAACEQRVEAALGGRVQRFYEVPIGPGWRETIPAAIEAIAATGAGAKIRCGGPVAEAFPAPEQVACLVHACRRQGVRFKATAGLHDPIRHRDGASGVAQHGFLNLLAAAVFAHAEDLPEAELTALLAEERPERFAVTPAALEVGGLAAGAEAIARARAELFVGYGSCSFAEPVDQLRALGMLPA
ncbi:MAG: hypothetical protein H0V40_09385, partial [Actinobacteria bacterium]|nr:hypothetical protein [Actinomycetota bacterium]